MRLWYEADCSHPSSAEVKNEWNCIPFPPKLFQGVCSENFTMLAKTICYLLSLPVGCSKVLSVVLHPESEHLS